MALKIRSTDNPALIGPIEAGWSVTEEVAPNAIGSSTASTGGASFTMGKQANAELLVNKNVTVYYEQEGTTQAASNVTGYFDSVSVDGASVAVTSTNKFTPLVANRSAVQTVIGSNFPMFTNTVLPGVNARNSAIDSWNSNIYIANSNPTNGTAISVYNQSGALQFSFGAMTTAGNTTGAVSSAGYVGLEVDYLGNIFAVDGGASRVNKFDANGNFLVTFGSSGTGSGQFSASPQDVGVDNNGLVYVASPGQSPVPQIVVFSNAGAFVRNISIPNSGLALGVGAYGRLTGNPGGDGVFYTSLSQAAYFTSTGTFSGWVTAATNAVDGGFTSLAVANNGDIYFTYFVGNLPAGFPGSGSYGIAYAPNKGTIASPSYSSTAAGIPIIFSDMNQYPPNAMTIQNGSLLITTGAGQTIYKMFSNTPTVLDLFNYYLSLIFGTNYTLSFSGINPVTVVQAWEDSVWTKLNELCEAVGKEMLLTNNTITVRDVGTSIIDITNKTAPSTQLANDTPTQQLAVQQYNSVAGMNTIYYDARVNGDTYSVDYGEVQETTLSTNFYGTFFNATGIASNQANPTVNGYNVYAANGVLVPAASLTAAGFSFTVRAGDAGTTDVILRIVGPKSTLNGLPGPFIVGYAYTLPDGSGNNNVVSVPVIRLSGTGVLVNPQTVTVWTGADASKITTTDPQTIDNVFINTPANVYGRSMWASALAAGPQQNISFDIPISLVGSFGTAPGSTFIHGFSRYRVLQASYNNLTVSLTCEPYNTVGEHDALWTGQTVGTHDAAYAGRTVSDMTVKPLSLTS